MTETDDQPNELTAAEMLRTMAAARSPWRRVGSGALLPKQVRVSEWERVSIEWHTVTLPAMEDAFYRRYGMTPPKDSAPERAQGAVTLGRA